MKHHASLSSGHGKRKHEGARSAWFSWELKGSYTRMAVFSDVLSVS